MSGAAGGGSSRGERGVGGDARPGPGPRPGPGVPRTAAEWDRVAAAKAEVLTRDPFGLDPAAVPGVRPEVVRSWRRAVLAGVDPTATGFAHDDVPAGTRLAAVAQPILDRLADQISDLGAWGFLADRGCRLLTTVVGDLPPPGRLLELDLRRGTCFAEDVMGTNGLGCAHEEQRSFLISGTEHFRDDSGGLTTTGAILRDPSTRRYVGTLGVHCRREYGSAAVLPLVVELGRSIEAQLLATRSDGEREFFDAYLAASRRARGPVVGVTGRLCVVSTRARELVHEADEELLRRLAEEHGPARAPRTVHRRLSSGVGVSITVQPVDQPRGEYAAVLVLAPQPDASGTTVAPPGDAAAEEPGLAVQLDRALATRRPVLVIGERGTGKRHTARAALRGTVVEVDAALAGPDPEGWLRELLAAVRDERATVLLTHLSELPGRLAGQVADLVGGAPGRVVGTASADTGPDAAALLVREAFPVVLTVPPVRERRAEFAALCRSLLEELGAEDGRPSVLTTRALAALSAGDWPGNVRQLLQVLATARIRVAGTTIDVADLPPSSRGASPGRTLGELERIERQALAAALREAGGNRRTAAERLGISRATVYRKIKRYELH